MLFIRKRGLSFTAAGLTDIGMVRTQNEDNLFVLDDEEPNSFGALSHGIYIIADGMGGHQAGEVASEIAVRVISKELLVGLETTSDPISPTTLVEKAIEQANSEIYNASKSKPELFGMGTTITLGFRLDNRLYLGHVGDSRAYLMRKGKLQQMTEDHSLVARLIKEKAITQEEARFHPDRGKILRCLGVSDKVMIDFSNQVNHGNLLTLIHGDSLIFCSDGLSGYISDLDILNCLKKNNIASITCKELIDLANSSGGGDNISVIVVRVK